MSEQLIRDVFELSPDVRYVAVRRGASLVMRERGGLASASSAESDRYEELLVNPTLLTLARARGEIDCGGLRYLVVGYGSFHQLVVPLADGHVSIAVERTADPVPLVTRVLELVERHDGGATSGPAAG